MQCYFYSVTCNLIIHSTQLKASSISSMWSTFPVKYENLEEHAEYFCKIPRLYLYSLFFLSDLLLELRFPFAGV